ncbi:prolyl aminopeptidase-like protein [Cadophora sp. MPI-SDFR-AT-0126]|nr:prolyl aminopeptidase-like protein [Leotiomycetes sp. MPI-SDFR-AT-0126]
MASSVFKIKEHVVECQHIREYARATSTSQEAVLHLSVKQYTPLDNLQPQDGDVTIISAHANGFPKELYEPLWEDLHARSKSSGFRIRSIWIADVAQQGQSGVLNEGLLGNDPAWSDHPRDLLHMINQFRSEMPLPIVGIGHSFGANTLCNLSLIHPRLFTTLVLLDPVVQREASSPGGPGPAAASTFRRDLWPSRAEAEAAFRKQKFYQTWDPRALDIWCKYGIRETPTALYPNEKGSVTLTTTKHQECFTFLRPTWEAMNEDGTKVISRDLVPDMRDDSPSKFPFYRPEPYNTLVRLSELRPSVLYVFGSESDMSAPATRKYKIDITGSGTGGSGGAKEGRVEEVLLEGIGHLVAMEASQKCADSSAAWLGKELKRFEEEKKKYVEWTKQGFAAKTTLSEEWQKRIGGPLKRPKSKI